MVPLVFFFFISSDGAVEDVVEGLSSSRTVSMRESFKRAGFFGVEAERFACLDSWNALRRFLASSFPITGTSDLVGVG